MSYDCYAVMRTGDTPDSQLSECLGNITSNVSPMWRDAMPDGQHVLDLHGKLCAECVAPLRVGIYAMTADPDRYRAMNPDNGWGDYEGALRYLRELLAGCELHPLATFEVSA